MGARGRRFASSGYGYFMRGFGRPLAHEDPSWPLIWIGVYSAIALILVFATLRTFDRCLGRVKDRDHGLPARRA